MRFHIAECDALAIARYYIIVIYYSIGLRALLVHSLNHIACHITGIRPAIAGELFPPPSVVKPDMHGILASFTLTPSPCPGHIVLGRSRYKDNITAAKFPPLTTC